MMISNERIEEFRRIYKKAYGEEVTVAEAREMANRLDDQFSEQESVTTVWRLPEPAPEICTGR